MDKSDDAPLSRSEFVKILLSTPSNCELRCQVLKVFPTFRGAKCMINFTLRCTQNVSRYFCLKSRDLFLVFPLCDWLEA